jgi:hypothetical protein
MKDGAASSDPIRELADYLVQCQSASACARLSPEMVLAALSSVRSYLANSEARIDSAAAYRIVLLGAEGWLEKTIAIIRCPEIARRVFDEAASMNPDRTVQLLQGTFLVASAP